MARTSLPSREYWREREIEHAKIMLKDDMKVVDRMKDLYEDTAREIEKEINTMLSNYATRNELSFDDVRQLVNDTDIRAFERKAARYVREKNFSDRANREMAIYNLKMKVSRLEMTLRHIDLELIAMTDGLEKLTYDRLIQVGMEELERQAGILGADFEFDRTGVDYIARQQFHGEDFSDRLWRHKNELHTELEKRLVESITRGQSPIEAARKLRQEIESSVFNSERLLITETARVQSEVQMESFKQLDIHEYEFIATEAACEVCKPLDGEIFSVNAAMPGTNMPPMHPFCRCSTAGHVDREVFERELERRGL